MYSYTAAHKTLPFGTKLNITNPENGKSTSVTINDRGPFVPGRDIDLSYQAAKVVGLINKGTGRVRVYFTGRDESYRKSVKMTDRYRGPFTIQVGSFVQYINAIRLKKALRLSREDIYIRSATIHGETMFRVRVGKFHDREKALQLAERLANEGYSVLLMNYDGLIGVR